MGSKTHNDGVELFPTHLSLCSRDDAGNGSTSLPLPSSPSSTDTREKKSIRGFLAMAAYVRSLSPTHTHTCNARSPRNNTKRKRCVTHLLIVIDVVTIQGRRIRNWELLEALPFAASLWVSFLSHTAYAASVWVMRKMRGRSCVVLLSAHPLLLFLRDLSSHTSLMQQVCRKREGRGCG